MNVDVVISFPGWCTFFPLYMLIATGGLLWKFPTIFDRVFHGLIFVCLFGIYHFTFCFYFDVRYTQLCLRSTSQMERISAHYYLVYVKIELENSRLTERFLIGSCMLFKFACLTLDVHICGS